MQMHFTTLPVPLVECLHALIPVEQAYHTLHSIAVHSLQTLLRVETRALCFAQCLIDNPKQLVAHGGTEWISYGEIFSMGLFEQTNALMNVLTPTKQPAREMECEGLAVA